ncbi:unnamed protein product, partial [Prorocentrum cordatum]
RGRRRPAGAPRCGARMASAAPAGQPPGDEGAARVGSPGAGALELEAAAGAWKQPEGGVPGPGRDLQQDIVASCEREVWIKIQDLQLRLQKENEELAAKEEDLLPVALLWVSLFLLTVCSWANIRPRVSIYTFAMGLRREMRRRLHHRESTLGLASRRACGRGQASLRWCVLEALPCPDSSMVNTHFIA